MFRFSRICAYALVVALLSSALPSYAARPLLDYHRLDAYFALYAPDTSVPWKNAAVRLDTYTSAPVDFAVYRADVADVISAGENTRPRAIDTRRMHSIARWSYTPPGGYRFQSNDVPVPLGNSEGFYVVEARRGTVGEQVWIDRTRIGLLSKETPSGILVYGADLGTGRPLSNMRVSFIAKRRFVDRYTMGNGTVTWRGNPRPVFAMAQWGSSSAFLSFLPQAPLPRTIVGLKTDSAVVHAGDPVRVIGFVRTRAGGRLRPGTGTVNVALRSPRGAVAQASPRLDAAGAFTATLHVPDASQAGDYTILASNAGATSATSLHVDANANGLSLSVAPQCEGTCRADADVPLEVRAMRAGVPAPGVEFDAEIIRSPHAYPDEPAVVPWGISPWFSAHGTTGADGRAIIRIPRPADGLASTYGVRVSSGGATADTRVAVPTSLIVLRVQIDQTDIGGGMPAQFDVFALNFTNAKPAPGLRVRVELMHGASVQQQIVTLDDRGHARGAFTAPQIGTNLIVASLVDGSAMDAAQLQVEPQMMQMSASGGANVAIALDRASYGTADIAHIDATVPDAAGSALLTLESADGTQNVVVPVSGGHADARMRIGNAAGTLSAGAAFVRDGALLWDSVPLTVDAPGRPLSAPLVLDRSAYGPGALATVRLGGVRGGVGTVVLRVTKGAPSGSAVFSTAPDLLAVGTTATQDTAAEGGSWHPWVDSTGDHPTMQTFARRSVPPQDMTMTQADTASVYWKVDRQSGDGVQLQVPVLPGKYVISLLKVDDDGRVTAASGDLVVQ